MGKRKAESLKLVVIYIAQCFLEGNLHEWESGKVSSCSFRSYVTQLQASQLTLMVKNPPANAGDVRDSGSVSE